MGSGNRCSFADTCHARRTTSFLRRERKREIPSLLSLLLFYFRFVHSFRSVSFRLVWLVRDGFEREETDGTRSRGGGVKGVVSMM